MKTLFTPEMAQEILKNNPSTKTIITPEMAKEILKNNPSNRPIKPANVAFFVSQIREGKFRYNGESVIISKTGVLLNGQHRLMGCVETGIPIETVLVTDVDDDVMPTIDTGSPRTAANVFHMNDVKNSTNLAAGVRNIMNVMGSKRQKVSTTRQSVKVSNMDILEFYNSHKQALDSISKFATHINGVGVRILTPAKLIGYIYLLGREDDPKVVVDFFRELLTGVTLRESTAARVLRDKLINNRLSSTKLKDNTVNMYVIKAFKHYVNGKSVKYLKLQAGEVFTIKMGNAVNIDYAYMDAHSSHRKSAS